MMRFRRLTRNLTDRTLGGVCGGLAAYIGVNPWWLRAAFVLLTFFTTAAGVALYFLLWLILPPETLADYSDGASNDYRRASSPEVIILIGAAAVGIGLIVLAQDLDVLTRENGDAFLPLMVVALGVVFLVKRWRGIL